MKLWQGAIVATVLIAVAIARSLPNSRNTDLVWKPYTHKYLTEARESGHIVLVSFTADWCLTCKTAETLFLHTDEINHAIKTYGVIALKADWTHGNPEVTRMLEQLGSKQIPTIAVFPPRQSIENPIVIRGGYTKHTILDAIRQASGN
jgi:suppressor for copper-sensitivity B